MNAQDFTLTLIRTEKLTYETRDLWNLIVQNVSQEPAAVYLQAYITELEKGREFEVRSADFILSPGVTQFNTANYSQLLPEQVLFQKRDFRDHVVRTSSFPNGEYEICVFLFDSRTTQILARDCYTILQLTTTPPYLISPNNQDTVREEFPFFIWSPPAPQQDANQVTYELSVYEIYPQQTFISAVQTNPEWLQVQEILSPLYQYGLDLRPLVPGRRYSWFISAYINGLPASQSEIWEFVYQPLFEESEEETLDEKNVRKPGTIYYMLSEERTFNNYTLRNDELNFIFTNQNYIDQLPYRIVDFQGTIIHHDQLSVVYGQNFISINLSEFERVEKNELLILEIKDISSPRQFLCFKYSPEEK
jgi:hypothetical protein